ncbi:hypothetical protein [Mycobacterium sp. 155]|uniref:hypothetical protein n=1 Tax=Mycobacterium sp. 155 TaxID=1157943 RepID=UPI0003A31823|nr:hypothetical protein [Mycobacterium sp. 155]
MAVAVDLGLSHLTRVEQVEHLRRKIAAVSRKVGPAHPEVGRTGAVVPTGNSLLELPESPADPPPAELLTTLPRGTVAVMTGARSLPLGMVAAVTKAGGHAAIVGQPDVGLLAAVEMGADLSRLAVVPDPGADPVEVASVLMDGMDLVLLGLGGRAVPPNRARVMVARARQKGCTLLVVDGNWQGASTRLEARVCGYDVTGAGDGAPVPGRGRIGRVRLSMRGAAGSVCAAGG